MLNLVLVLALLAQAPPRNDAAPSGVITGRVVADDTGEPVPNARITVIPSVPNAPVVRSDREGRFELAVPAGASRVAASKPGYLRGEVPRPAQDQSIAVRLHRASAISGRILDQAGDPVIGAQVAVERLLDSGRTSQVKSAETDDNGEYRIGGLASGMFVVGVRVMNTMTRVIAEQNMRVFTPEMTRLYYPGVAAANDADRIRLATAEDRSGADITVPAQYSGGEPFGIIASLRQTRSSARPDVDSGTAVIRGKVVTPGGQPIAHAHVRLLLPDDFAPQRTAIADDEGRFAFGGLPPGSFRVAAEKPGYAAEHGEDLAVPGFQYLGAGPLVTLADRDSRSVDITLVRFRALSGYILDEHSDAVEGARVQLLHVRYAAGRRSLVPADVDARMTDDRGHYRVFGIPPGDYIVSASVGSIGSADLGGYARTYFPGSREPVQAQFVSIGVAQDVSGIDFALERAATARVSGAILNAASEPTTGGSVRLTPRSTALRNVSTGARILPGGEFAFDNVAPGDYIVRADFGRSGAAVEGEFGVLPVTVIGNDVEGLVLRMSSGSSILGRFRFESDTGSNTPAPSAIELSPIAVDPDLTPDNVAVAEIHEDWTFEMHGINGKRRLELVHVPPGWALKEITARGNDVTDRILSFGTTEDSLNDVEVVLTDRVAEINGSLAGDRRRPAAGSHVIVASMDRREWYPASRFLRHGLVEQDGTFRIAGLPAATYYVVASANVPAGGEDAWQDPEFLESIVTRAVTVTLQDGEKRSVHLEARGN